MSQVNLADFIPDFKKIWDEKSTIIEKAYFVRVADLNHVITVFTDTCVSPKWTDIETNYQQLLREAIRKVLGA